MNETAYMNLIVVVIVGVGSWIFGGIISLLIAKAVVNVEIKHVNEKIETTNQTTNEIKNEIKKEIQEIKRLIFHEPDGKPIYVRTEDCRNERESCHKLICGKINDLKSIIAGYNTLRESARRDNQVQLEKISNAIARIKGKLEIKDSHE